MRKLQKTQIEEFLAMLDEAHCEIVKAIKSKNVSSAMELLECCQEYAIKIGGIIEEAEGEGFVTVHMLEEYCELVYQIYEKLGQQDYVSLVETEKTLNKYFTRISKSVQNDIKVRKEVVFLPYKASMWDSLESVWQAAAEDPDCDAYVIPIPYYDKNPDGTLGEMHYEGELYPDYVPVTHYEDYDFEGRRPDAIYIHNPYDGYNKVTSVPPFFYAKNLKNLTEELVYIPYFVLPEISPDDQAAIEKIRHFCVTPGVIHAHKVIVQSEDMKQIYVNVMCGETGEHTRSYWEDKILGLGSPKLDKVSRTKKEDIDVPQEWLKFIQKEDGSYKKIIFYNTTIVAFLEHREKMLKKIRWALGVFRENVSDVVLLWRPHPLIKATIESMHPDLWEEYGAIVKCYKAEGWGIYDDTADVHRAVALCDAYYGDMSSVVELCKKAGKPVMIQDVEIL